MFDVETFVAECQAAIRESDSRRAIRDVLERAVSDPTVADVLPPERAGIQALHNDDELTVIKVVWAPGMSIRPHDHRMWAAIGIYGGQEDNAFFRRTPEGIVPSGGKSLQDHEVVLLGDDTIHSVHNPRRTFTGAIHVYGGDFFTQPRSEWDEKTLTEEPYDVARTLRLFEEQNEKLGV